MDSKGRIENANLDAAEQHERVMHRLSQAFDRFLDEVETIGESEFGPKDRKVPAKPTDEYVSRMTLVHYILTYNEKRASRCK